MNIQEIFNLVIDQGCYDTSDTNSAMCSALHTAWYRGVVSNDEAKFAQALIKKYLLPTDCIYLGAALKNAGLPHTIEARTAIYRDWANRPALPISTT